MRNKEQKTLIIVSFSLTVALSIVAFLLNAICGILCLLLGVLLSGIYIHTTHQRYKKIDELNSYLSKVLSGDYDMDIALNTEGELSILENNLLKVITNLKASNEAVKNDKIYLADSLADISHQLKTPLTSMMVITDLLRDEQDENKKQEFIGIIDTQCEKMRWLISNLLKLSKLDAGTVEFIKTSFKASDLIDTSVKPFELTFDLKNIDLKKDINEFEIIADKNWLCEAIQNIIKNCIEHTSDNGRLTIATTSTNLYNQIVIEDNGCGIASEDLPHIFERFYYGKNASSDSVGIGLALSKEILKNQNASITVQSTEGVGTKFDIRFYKSII